MTDGAGAIALEIELQRASMQDPIFLDRLEKVRQRVRRPNTPVT